MERNFDQVRQSLAHNIRSLRSQQGLSQEALALNAEVDRTYVSQIERAVGNPSLLVLCKLAAILRVDTIDLVAPGIQATTLTSSKTP
jgi:transcriptional regulator with XRE-family HTH domain